MEQHQDIHVLGKTITHASDAMVPETQDTRETTTSLDFDKIYWNEENEIFTMPRMSYNLAPGVKAYYMLINP